MSETFYFYINDILLLEGEKYCRGTKMITISGLNGVPKITTACDLPKVLAKTIKKEKFNVSMAILFVWLLKYARWQKVILST